MTLAARKNDHYVEMISNLDETACPGAKKLLLELKSAGYKIALGSAKNARPVLNQSEFTLYLILLLTVTAPPNPNQILKFFDRGHWNTIASK